MLESERLLLRPIELADVTETYRCWMNDPAVMQYTESRFQTHSLEQIRQYVLSVQADASSRFFAIVEKASAKHIGNVKIGHIHPVHRHADVGIIIGDKACWGKGYAAESLRLVAGYARESLKLHKLMAGIYANNIGSIQAFLKAGFVQEGRFASHWFCDGEFVDGWQMGLLLEESL
jgi:RimJ/RimL family protein N-acetyltransferase